jgi:hypothetical protein
MTRTSSRDRMAPPQRLDLGTFAPGGADYERLRARFFPESSDITDAERIEGAQTAVRLGMLTFGKVYTLTEALGYQRRYELPTEAFEVVMLPLSTVEMARREPWPLGGTEEEQARLRSADQRGTGGHVRCWRLSRAWWKRIGGTPTHPDDPALEAYYAQTR